MNSRSQLRDELFLRSHKLTLKGLMRDAPNRVRTVARMLNGRDKFLLQTMKIIERK